MCCDASDICAHFEAGYDEYGLEVLLSSIPKIENKGIFAGKAVGGMYHLVGAWAWEYIVGNRSVAEVVNDGLIARLALAQPTDTTRAPLHAAVWTAMSKADTANTTELWALGALELCGKSLARMRPLDSHWSALLRNCIHGFGHGVLMSTILYRNRQLPRSACIPFQEHAFDLRQGELATALAICEAPAAPSTQLAHICGVGAYMSYFQLADPTLNKGGVGELNAWAGPCMTTKFAAACFTRLYADVLLDGKTRGNLFMDARYGKHASLIVQLRRCLTLAPGGGLRKLQMDLIRQNCIFGAAAELLPLSLQARSEPNPPVLALERLCSAFLPLAPKRILEASETRHWLHRHWLACVGGASYGAFPPDGQVHRTILKLLDGKSAASPARDEKEEALWEGIFVPPKQVAGYCREAFPSLRNRTVTKLEAVEVCQSGGLSVLRTLLPQFSAL